MPSFRTLSRLRTLLAALMLTAFAATSAAADGHDAMESPAPSLYAKVFDLVLVRPLGLVPTILTPVGCALGLPVAWAMGSPVDASQVCIDDALEWSFTRPLGEL